MNRIDAASIAVPESSLLPEENEEPPGTPRRHPKWNDVPDEQWDDWRWQMQNAIRTTSQLFPGEPNAALAQSRRYACDGVPLRRQGLLATFRDFLAIAVSEHQNRL